MQPITPFSTRMKLRGFRQMADQHRPTSVWPPMTSNYYQTGQSLHHWPAIICPSSSPSTPICPRLKGLSEPTSTSIKADWARYAEACDKYLAEAGETRTVKQAEKTFRKTVNKASDLFITAGRIQRFLPTLLASAKSLADERDRNRRRKAQRSKQIHLKNWWWKTSEPNGNRPLTKSTIEQAYRIHGGLLRA